MEFPPLPKLQNSFGIGPDRSEKAKRAFMLALGLVPAASRPVVENAARREQDLQLQFEYRKARALGRPIVAHALATDRVAGSSNMPSATEVHNEPMDHDDMCAFCGNGGELLMCDTCPLVFHLACLEPPLFSVPEGSWLCPRCAALDTERAREVAAYGCGSLASQIADFEQRWFQLQKYTTSEIERLELRQASLHAQSAQLQQSIAGLEDIYMNLRNQVELFQKHEAQTSQELNHLRQSLSSLIY